MGRKNTIDPYDYEGPDPDVDDMPLQRWVVDNPDGWSREEQVTFCRQNGLRWALEQLGAPLTG